MITFACGGCGKAFAVPDEFAGRRASCKACGASIQVPAKAPAVKIPAASITEKTTRAETVAVSPVQSAAVQQRGAGGSTVATAVAAPPSRVPVRTRRLISEAQQMREAFADSPFIHVTPIGADPPEQYRITFNVDSIEKLDRNEKPIHRDSHEVEIQLTSDYPRFAPKCKMITPVFHPNIDETTICVGDHWTAGEKLVDLVIRIGEMLAYQAYNIKSPLNAEAAMWADLNGEKLPTDGRNLRPGEH